jgi:hypothetical protein
MAVLRLRLGWRGLYLRLIPLSNTQMSTIQPQRAWFHLGDDPGLLEKQRKGCRVARGQGGQSGKGAEWQGGRVARGQSGKGAEWQGGRVARGQSGKGTEWQGAEWQGGRVARGQSGKGAEWQGGRVARLTSCNHAISGDGRRFGQARRFKSAADSQSALKRTGCSSNPLKRVLAIRHRF